MATPAPYSPLKAKVFDVIFEADTPWGKVFDISLLVLILLSVVIIMLESVEEYDQKYGTLLHTIDWIITGLFTIEYCLRIWCVTKPWRYAKSFYGVVDLLSILPMYLSLILEGSNVLVTIRALRLLRVFRVLRVSNYLVEAQTLNKAITASRNKILVFLGTVMIMVVIVGSVMYYLEGIVYGNDNFDSIPRSMYWAVVTVTTVGYGDITPVSTIGQFFSAILMILGYGILAVPTGIVSAEMVSSNKMDNRACHNCGQEGHDNDARFCKHCGTDL
ncbi:MAG: ion transporter [Bacteroidia bacterium]